MKGAYYNEFDPRAAAWLRELIGGGHIAAGDVDERSILDVKPDEIKNYAQCHFFAGIGGWSLALRLAGIPDDFPIYSGSCPCQPLSGAGRKKGHADERHLWPAFHDILAERRPAKVVGEQVASADGREWLAGIRADMEDLGYAFGGADLCSAGVGAPNIRQRLYWLADANIRRFEAGGGNDIRQGGEGQRDRADVERHSGVGRLVDAEQSGLEGHARHGSEGRESGRIGTRARGSVAAAGSSGGVGDSKGGRCGELGDAAQSKGGGHADRANFSSHWADFEIAWCRNPRGGDPVPRRIESGTFPMAARLPSRVGCLRGYGNAINPQIAALFLKACDLL